MVAAKEGLCVRLDLVAGEGGLHSGHRGAVNLIMRIAPVVFQFGMALPQIGDADPRPWVIRSPFYGIGLYWIPACVSRIKPVHHVVHVHLHPVWGGSGRMSDGG